MPSMYEQYQMGSEGSARANSTMKMWEQWREIKNKHSEMGYRDRTLKRQNQQRKVEFAADMIGLGVVAYEGYKAMELPSPQTIEDRAATAMNKKGNIKVDGDWMKHEQNKVQYTKEPTEIKSKGGGGPIDTTELRNGYSYKHEGPTKKLTETYINKSGQKTNKPFSAVSKDWEYEKDYIHEVLRNYVGKENSDIGVHGDIYGKYSMGGR